MGDFRLLLPEMVVALTGALVLVADLVWLRRDERRPSARPGMAALAIAGLLVAAGASLAISGERGVMFSGILVHDELSTYFKLLFIAIAVVVILLSVDVLPRITRWPAEFYALVVWCTLGHMLLSSAAELFTIFMCLQLTSLPLIVLIGYAKRDPLSGEAAIKYLLLVLVSTAVLLYGMTLIYGALGTSTLSEIAVRIGGLKALQPVVALGLVLLLSGFAFKVTAVPFQWWVPDVYEGAPTPVTAFLSVGSKFAGFALALRILFAADRGPVDLHLVLAGMAVASMTFGNLAAIRQMSLKRMLAYSGIAQAGYLLVGLANLRQDGVGAVLFFMAAYAAANLLAFGAVIAFEREAGGVAIADLAGLAKRAPVLALALAAALLSLAGLPLLAGFMAKFEVFLGAARAGMAWLVAVAVANSVVALYYYLRVVWRMYVAAPEPDAAPVLVRRPAAAAMAACAAVVVVAGLAPEPLLRAALQAAASYFGG